MVLAHLPALPFVSPLLLNLLKYVDKMSIIFVFSHEKEPAFASSLLLLFFSLKAWKVPCSQSETG